MLHHGLGQDSIEEARIGSTDQMYSVGRLHVLDHVMRSSQQGSAIKTEPIVAAGYPVVTILAGKEVFEYRLIVPSLVEQVHPALTPSHAVEGPLSAMPQMVGSSSASRALRNRSRLWR